MPVANTPSRLFVPAQAVGASKVFFDLWNGSPYPMVLRSVIAVKDGSVAVTGVVADKLFLTRTSTIGTGGTAAVAEGTDTTVPALTRGDTGIDISLVTARAAPAGGATAGAVIAERQIFPEETAAEYGDKDFLLGDDDAVIVPPGTGVRVVQGTVASVGNIGFAAAFEMRV